MVIKKLWLGLLVMVLVFGITVFGCDEGDDNTHRCSFSDGWLSNATQHWKVCSCGEKDGTANHSFHGSICIVCQYNNGNGEISISSLTTRQQLLSYNSKYYYTIGIFLKMSNGSNWSSDPGHVITKSWVNVTTTIDLTSWTFQADYNSLMPNSLYLWYTSPAQDTPITMPGGGISTSINSTKLNEMKGYTNVINTFSVGTPSSASSTAWEN